MAQQFLGSLHLWKVIHHEKCQFSPTSGQTLFFIPWLRLLRLLSEGTCTLKAHNKEKREYYELSPQDQ